MRKRIRKRATGLKVNLPATRWQKTRVIRGEERVALSAQSGPEM
jgi:hypothetical protein